MLNDTIGSGANNPAHPAGWTEERTEKLKSLWREGKSATEVATILGGGLTRNGVIGKVYRLKLDTRSKPVKVAKPVAAPRKPREITAPRPNGNKGQPKASAIQHRLTMAEAKPPAPMPVPVGLPAAPDRLRLSDVTGRCKWCEGDPLTPDHSFCGQPVKAGTSWCPDHHARVYPPR